ncbi:MAG TPA: NAD(P) transhydrogenase subunit alpha [Alphaproteobacteria bacterium]|nr:NAD(P) transhydrogenase subunit alpha [Alphaproteobacteria bacterium]
MKLFLCSDLNSQEHRTPLTPEGVKKLTSLGFEILVQKDAGNKSGFKDQEYIANGAKIVKGIENADFYFMISAPFEDLDKYKKNAAIICQSSGLDDQSTLEALNAHGLSYLALNKVPRITKAQSMDVLSSQSNLAGYRAVIEASYHFTKIFPMMMTAAGTIAPARVTVLGAGVAGLQAIATAKRLGAIVTGYDVRPAAWEQIESLGAKALKVSLQESGDGAGGYAKEMSDDFKKAQEEALKKHLLSQNIIITTAQIPGKKAPILLSKEMIESLSCQSIIVDLAAATGGNCDIEIKSPISSYKGVTIISDPTLLNRVAYDASVLYSRNMVSFVTHCIDPKEGLKENDEIVVACYSKGLTS